MDLSFIPRNICTRIETIRNQEVYVKQETEEYQLPGVRIYVVRVEYILQNGPQCGLVALQMAAMVMGERHVPVSEIYVIGKEMGYTNNGEIFSTEYMAELTHAVYPGLVGSSLDFPSPPELAHYLLEGKMLLVPYDCDRNHEPALLRGHKAHWALITGFLVTSPEIEEIEGITTPLSKKDFDRPMYVLAQHGKSKFMALWKYSDLQTSNAQLDDPGPERPDTEYIFPSSGMQLKNRCVVLSRN